MIDENALHARTQDAYSFDRYGAEAWMNAIRLLAPLYTEAEVEWILYSKYMRWAADRFGEWSGDVDENGEDIGHMILDGEEIIKYAAYNGGIEIERDVDGNPDMY